MSLLVHIEGWNIMSLHPTVCEFAFAEDLPRLEVQSPLFSSCDVGGFASRDVLQAEW